MSEEITAPVETGSEPVSAPLAQEITAPEGTPERLSPREAGRLLASLRKSKQEAAPEPTVEQPPEEIPSQEENAEPQPETEAAGETQEVEAETPQQIDPPRSWSKEARENWSKLDPATQNYILERAQQDDSAVQKAQREAAEVRRTIESERQQMEQARQQYESAALQMAQMFASSNEFADIQTPADEMRLAKEDVLRYAQYQAFKSQREATQRAAYEAQSRQQQEYSNQLKAWGDEQDRLAMDVIPEAKDEAQWKSLRENSINYLRDVGFDQQELAQLWGNSILRDHRVQRIIADGAKAKQALAQLEKAKAKPLPPVQRPGVAPARGAAITADIKALDQKLSQTGSVKDAARLYAAQMKARSR